MHFQLPGFNSSIHHEIMPPTTATYTRIMDSHYSYRRCVYRRFTFHCRSILLHATEINRLSEECFNLRRHQVIRVFNPPFFGDGLSQQVNEEEEVDPDE